MGWFNVIRDWQMVKKQKEGFLDALRQTPPGAGVSIKDPANPITARAIIEILRDHPNEIEAMDYGFEVTLMRKVGMVNSMTRDSYEHLRNKHQILSADSIDSLGLRGQAHLPNRKFRDGVPDDVNDEGAHTATIIGVDTSGGKRG
jgi:hypothetical protein